MKRPWKLQARQSGKDGRWYVNLSGANGETIMRSKGYDRQGLAEALCTFVQAARIEVLPTVVAGAGAVPQGAWRVEPHKSLDDGLYYNRLTQPNGTIAMWSEGYVRQDAARRACLKMRDAMVVTLPPLPHRKT